MTAPQESIFELSDSYGVNGTYVPFPTTARSSRPLRYRHPNTDVLQKLESDFFSNSVNTLLSANLAAKLIATVRDATFLPKGGVVALGLQESYECEKFSSTGLQPSRGMSNTRNSDQGEHHDNGKRETRNTQPVILYDVFENALRGRDELWLKAIKASGLEWDVGSVFQAWGCEIVCSFYGGTTALQPEYQYESDADEDGDFLARSTYRRFRGLAHDAYTADDDYRRDRPPLHVRYCDFAEDAEMDMFAELDCQDDLISVFTHQHRQKRQRYKGRDYPILGSFVAFENRSLFHRPIPMEAERTLIMSLRCFKNQDVVWIAKPKHFEGTNTYTLANEDGDTEPLPIRFGAAICIHVPPADSR
jgi:hypothetical protein